MQTPAAHAGNRPEELLLRQLRNQGTLGQRARTKNDFVVEPKRARGAPAPVAVNETHAPTWGPAPQNNVSTRTGCVWATLNDDANSLFGKAPAEIISRCDEYVTKSRNLDNPAAKKAAYLEFILSLS